ncbi:MAG: serine acetyltransferase [Clostridia bacterium]|nr:serine acetyltransferase [Clostridia bacterium]
MDKALTLAVLQADEALGRISGAQDGRFIGLAHKAERLTGCLCRALFPDFASHAVSRAESIGEAALLLQDCLSALLPDAERTEEILTGFLDALPDVRRQLLTDLDAAYRGDPAASSRTEIVLCYPGFRAVCIYRLAHRLVLLGVPILPRVMTEYAHRITGIDIHPGAVIGDAFFIDHGTGVVIGETTTIGHDVKLYQHVTLGAKSFDLLPDGSPVKGIKRHPDIGDRVVIYAGATILGGDTHVGNDCVIGGSVWLTHSVPAGKMVLARANVTNPALTRDIIPDAPMDSAML